MSPMFLFPNGQNIQFMPPMPPPQPSPEERRRAETDAIAKHLHATQKSKMVITKDVAPHMNRHQRRQQEAMLKKQAMSQAAEAAKKEIAKQKKEQSSG